MYDFWIAAILNHFLRAESIETVPYGSCHLIEKRKKDLVGIKNNLQLLHNCVLLKFMGDSSVVNFKAFKNAGGSISASTHFHKAQLETSQSAEYFLT